MKNLTKPLFVLSIISVSLLSSCVRSDFNKAYNLAKKLTASQTTVKSWGKACFSHYDYKKYLKDNSNNLDQNQINRLKEQGNIVDIFFTFVDVENTNCYGQITYATSLRKYSYFNIAKENGAMTVDAMYSLFFKAIEASAKNNPYITYGEYK